MTASHPDSSPRRSPFPRCLGFCLLAACLLLASGCQASGTLDAQPYFRPLAASDFFADGRSARGLVPGTVPQTDLPANDPATTGKNENGDPLATIPIPITADLVKRGQERFGIYCLVCHGVDGHGDGKVVPYGLSKPPDLLGAAVKTLPDGEIFAIISNGKGKMFSYAYRVKPPDRWAVIAYLRAMQMKNGHLTQDLTPAELQQLDKSP